MGDSNINVIIYVSHMETQDYIDAMFQHSFIPLLNKPISITTTTATIIDTYIMYFVQIISRMELCIHICLTTYQYV